MKEIFYGLGKCLSSYYFHDPRTCNNKKWNISQAGFTVIELLVVFFLMTVLAIMSFASFSAFNSRQQLNTAVLDVKNTLGYAKSQAINQVDTCPTGQQFGGYQVLIRKGGSCPGCLSSNDIEVALVCSGGPAFIKGNILPKGIAIDATSATSFLFNPLSGSVTGAGTIVLTQGTTKKNITVSATGIIQ